jgi:HSP20 family molecular chaperone IbpA
MEKSAEAKEMSRRASQEPSVPEQLQQGPYVLPEVDILEKPDELVLRADMPGVGADNVDIRVENMTLIINGKVTRRSPADANYLVREYDVYDFHREFLIGESIDTTKITAEYTDGIFVLHLPKAETMMARKIQVQKK